MRRLPYSSASVSFSGSRRKMSNALDIVCPMHTTKDEALESPFPKLSNLLEID